MRVAAVYLAVGLGVIYAADAIFPAVSVPDWALTLVVVLVGLGFPLAIALSWVLDVTPAGIVRTPAAGTHAAGTSASPPATADAGPGHEGESPRGDSRPELPFADMSPDADHEYFSDGLTEEIIADLAGIRALSVISRTSVMRFKDARDDIPSIGRQLGARYVLEGSVRKAGDRLRITAQLIDARTDAHLWADKYDGSIHDVFDVQERVSREIVSALGITLDADEESRLSEHPIRDVRAFELYLKARQQLQRYSTEGVAEMLNRAIEIEGLTPPLRALRGWARVNEVRSGLNRDQKPLDEAEGEAHELLRTAPRQPYGHALLGYVAYERGDQAAAVGHFRTALAIDPSDADSLFYLAVASIAAGRDDLGLQVSAQLLETDPLGPLSHGLAGALSWFVGRPEQAPAHMRRALELDPQNLILQWTAGYTEAILGRLDGAEPYAEWLRQHGPEVPYTLQLRSLLAALRGERERALDLLSSVDTAPLDAHHTFHLGESFAMADATERALELVEKAVRGGFYPYPYLSEYCPFMAPLRGTAEFDRILALAKERADAFPED